MSPIALALVAGGAWVAAVCNFIVNNGLTTACGIAALIASIYAIRVGRETLVVRALEKRLRQMEIAEREHLARERKEDDLNYE